MRTLFIAFISVLCVESAFGQLRLGFTSSLSVVGSNENQTLMLANNHHVIDYKLSYRSQTSLKSIGTSAFAEFETLWFQTDILYNESKIEYMFSDFTTYRSLDESSMIDTRHQIQIPVTAGITIGKTIRLGVGPVFTYAIDQDMTLLDYDGFKKSDKNVTKSFRFLTGINFSKHFHLDFIYEKGLSQIGDSYTYNNKTLDFSLNPSYYTVSLSFFL